MKKTILTFTILLLLVPITSYAGQENIDALAEKFLIVTKAKEHNDKITQMIKLQITQQIENLVKTKNIKGEKLLYVKKYMDKMTNAIIDELSWDKLKNTKLQVIKSIYKENELRELNQFFVSDLGKLYIEKQEETIQRLTIASQAATKNLMNRLRKIEIEMKNDIDG